jgi:hypothetical protein
METDLITLVQADGSLLPLLLLVRVVAQQVLARELSGLENKPPAPPFLNKKQTMQVS